MWLLYSRVAYKLVVEKAIKLKMLHTYSLKWNPNSNFIHEYGILNKFLLYKKEKKNVSVLVFYVSHVHSMNSFLHKY